MELLDRMMVSTTTEVGADLRPSGRPLEDWIVGAMEGRADQTVPVVTADAGSRWLNLARRVLSRRPDHALDAEKTEDQKQKPEVDLRVADIRGITVVKAMSYALFHDDDLDTIRGELDRLIAMGRVRIVLDLSEVHRAASRFLAILLAAHRRCVETGGLLKLCGLHPDVAELFTITGLERRFTIVLDEPSALNGAWPVPPLRPLPVEILLALMGRRSSISVDEPTPGAGTSEGTRDRASVETALRVELIVASGRFRGKVFPVAEPRFVIGRDPRCHLRSEGAGVSRVHAVIERRDSRVFLHDLASTNGVLLNGMTLWRDKAELADGDRLRIGRHRLTVSIGNRLNIDSREVDRMIAAWLLEEDGPTADPCAETKLDCPQIVGGVPTLPLPSPPLVPLAVRLPEGVEDDLMCHVVQDVLVVKLLTRLEDDAALDPIRAGLERLYEQTSLPRRVVFDLDGLASLSGRALGVLVAHALRLARAGGGLRLCQPSAHVLTVLEAISLPRVVSTYLRVDDAVVAAWE